MKGYYTLCRCFFLTGIIQLLCSHRFALSASLHRSEGRLLISANETNEVNVLWWSLSSARMAQSELPCPSLCLVFDAWGLVLSSQSSFCALTGYGTLTQLSSPLSIVSFHSPLHVLSCSLARQWCRGKGPHFHLSTARPQFAGLCLPYRSIH